MYVPSIVIFGISRAAVLGAALLAILVIVIATYLLLRIPRHRRRQVDAARNLFANGDQAHWRTAAPSDWTDEDRDTALRYYNTAGRQVRIGSIRLELIPEHDRTIAEELGSELTDADGERLADLMWLSQKLKRNKPTDAGASPESQSASGDEDTRLFKPTVEDSARQGALATALRADDETHALVDVLANSAENSDDTSPEKTLKKATNSLVSHVDKGDSDEHHQPDETATTTSREDDIDQTEQTTPADDAAEDRPNIPAWILEARDALAENDLTGEIDELDELDPAPAVSDVIEGFDDIEGFEDIESFETAHDAGEAVSVLAGSEFSWPDAAKDADTETSNLMADIDLRERESDEDETMLASSSGASDDESSARRSSRFSPGPLPERREQLAQGGTVVTRHIESHDEAASMPTVQPESDELESEILETDEPELDTQETVETRSEEPGAEELEADELGVDDGAAIGVTTDTSGEQQHEQDEVAAELTRLRKKARRAKRRAGAALELATKESVRGRKKRAAAAHHEAARQRAKAKKFKKLARRLEADVD
jgi:hypothetical protein